MTEIATGHVFLHPGKRRSTWYAKYRPPHGKQVKKRLGPAWTETGRPPEGYLTRKMAEAELRTLLSDADHDKLARKTGATFEDAAAKYLSYVEQVGGVEPAVLRDYRGVIDGYLIPWFGGRPVESIHHRDVSAYRDALMEKGRALRAVADGEPEREGKLSNRVVIRHLTVLHGVFKRARQVWDDLPPNPASAELVKRPRLSYDGDFQTLTADQVRLLGKHAADDQARVLYLTAAFTGLRMGELFALRWRDIDLEIARVHVRRNYTGAPKREKAPKSGKVRSVPLVDEVRVALNGLSQRDYLDQPDDLVFPSPSGGYLDDMAVRRAFVKALAAAELPRIRFHDLRHCFATLAVGVWELPRVQAYCGHAHISTTMRYVHHAPAAEDAATLSEALREKGPERGPEPAHFDGNSEQLSDTQVAL
jgi:integrase